MAFTPSGRPPMKVEQSIVMSLSVFPLAYLRNHIFRIYQISGVLWRCFVHDVMFANNSLHVGKGNESVSSSSTQELIGRQHRIYSVDNQRTQTDSPGGSAGMGAVSDVYECITSLAVKGVL